MAIFVEIGSTSQAPTCNNGRAIRLNMLTITDIPDLSRTALGIRSSEKNVIINPVCIKVRHRHQVPSQYQCRPRASALGYFLVVVHIPDRRSIGGGSICKNIIRPAIAVEVPDFLQSPAVRDSRSRTTSHPIAASHV